jgi:hypothetical protein
MRTIGWNEVQFDPAPGPREPLLQELGVMIARVVEKDMDERQHRIERFDLSQELDRRGGVDGFDLDHLGLPGFEVDRAVNIDPLTSARLFDRELLLFWRPTAGRPRRMGRMHSVCEQHGLVIAQGIPELFIALNESLLLLFVELARNDIRLVIFEPQAMQQRDQSRTAFVNEAEFLLDPGADVRVERGSVALTKTFNASSCAALKKLALPPMSNLVRPSIPCCSKSLNQPRGLTNQKFFRNCRLVCSQMVLNDNKFPPYIIILRCRTTEVRDGAF